MKEGMSYLLGSVKESIQILVSHDHGAGRPDDRAAGKQGRSMSG